MSRREIKFRAWDTDKEKMIYPSSRQSITTCCSCIEVLTCHEIAGGRYRTDITYACNGYSMQYTGLKDKNGKEIYEGDIYKQEVWMFGKSEGIHCGAVEYDSSSFIVRYPWGTSVLRLTGEVIGNIYENHELLETKDV